MPKCHLCVSLFHASCTFTAVPSKCPGSGTLAGCPTCCCSSSNNVEFYDPTRAEPVCTAPLALYEMKFVFTWSSDCQPDYIFSNSHWSPPAAATHSQNYRMWDACMDNPSEGVGLVSRTGNTSVINMEIIEQGFQGHILDFTMFDTYPIQNGVNNISIYLTADQDHQWVSAISMLAPSPDRMVGVADLRLCDGERWRERVKVCLELFSTATASEKVVGAMERNSIQFNNCSFGHIEFNLIKQVAIHM